MSYPRHRERAQGPFSDYYVKLGGGSNGPYIIEQDVEVMDDWVTPSFERQVHAGRIINNPCNYVRTQVASQGYPGTRSVRFGSSTDSWSGALMEHYLTVYRPSVDLSALVSLVRDRAKLESIAYIDSTPYAFGEDLGELGETIHFLRNPLGSIFNLSKSFRKTVDGKRRSGLARTKAVADVWLSYRFAFSPLVRSASDLLEAYSTKVKQLPVRLTSHGKDQRSAEGASSLNGEQSSSNYTVTCSASREIEGHASILYEVSNPIRDWRYRYGLRGKDLPTTFWQLVPYSFMVDRLFDVSSFSRGIINLADPRVNILAASYTVRDEKIETFTFSESAKSGWTVTSSPNTHVDTSFVYNRSRWSPSVADVIPRIEYQNVVNTATKIADLVTLTIANLR